MTQKTKNNATLAALLWLFLLFFGAVEKNNIIDQIRSVHVIFAETTGVKTYSISGYNWTDTRASAGACNSYCQSSGYTGGTVSGSGTKTCAGATCAFISDFNTGTVSQVGNDGNCGCNSQFTCSCTGTSTTTPPTTATSSDWDVSVKFDMANKGSFYPFSVTAGTIGMVYYSKLNQEDNLYTLTPYNQTCLSYWPYDPVSTRAVGWFAERKKVTDNKYKLLIRGTASADCNYGGSGAVRGELDLNSGGDWKITEVVNCSAQQSNKGQEVYCQTSDNYVKFSAGSNCGGCCACADSGSVSIEVIVEKNPNTCGNEVCETGESGTTCASDCAKPDLVVDSITVEPANPTTQSDVCLYATIKNTGNEAVSSDNINVTTYINENLVSDTAYGNILGIGEELKKQIYCSKYGQNASFKIGENNVKAIVDSADINAISELNEGNNEKTASFAMIDEPADWDVSVKFDTAHKGSFYPFSALPGAIGTMYYAKLNTTDSLLVNTPYNQTCTSGYPYADANSTRVVGWYAQREKITDAKYRLKIQGTAPADCNYSGAGASKGQLDLNPSGDWKITQVVSCSSQQSNKGQTVYCETGDKFVKFSAGSNCGGCCACADSGSITIEVIAEKEGAEPEPEPLPTCVRANPTVSIIPTFQTGYIGVLGKYAYDVTIVNNDSASCAESVFQRWGSSNIPSGATFTDDYSGGSLPAIAAGASLKYKTYITTQPNVTQGNYQISVLVENSVDGKIYSATGEAGLELKNVPEPPKCTDSDDGLDYYLKGMLMASANEIITTRYDSCSADGNILTEWYCSGTNVAESLYECPNGCLDGACIEDKNEKIDVEVVAPNGGESYKAEEKITITFKNPLTAKTKITVTNLVDPEYDLGEISGNWTEWTIPANVKEGKYKVSAQAVDADGASGLAKDLSDNFFDISAKEPGTCLADGTLVRLPDDFKVYVIKNCKKQWVKTQEKFTEMGLDWSNVNVDVTKEVVDTYSEYIAPVVFKAENDYKVYEVIEGKKLWIPTISSFQEQGLSWSEVENTDDETVSQYEDVKLLKSEKSSRTYYLTENGYKKQIPNSEILKEYTDKWGDVTTVTKDIANSIPETKLVRGEKDTKVYRIYGTRKKWVKDEEVFARYEYDWSQVVPVSETELSSYSDAGVID